MEVFGRLNAEYPAGVVWTPLYLILCVESGHGGDEEGGGRIGIS